MSELYKRFALNNCPCLDFSEQAKEDMYLFESRGVKLTDMNNGYLNGKRIMDITVAAWKEDIPLGILSAKELQLDYPDWFLNKVGLLKKGG